MVYHQKLVAVVKVNGKILRENKDQVTLPFGSEYSILLKNLDSRKVLVNVSIDGNDAITGLIIDPNSEVELERYVKDLDKGNRFKFIEMTDDLEQRRGNKVEDGLIKITYQFEAVVQDFITYSYHSSTPKNSDWFVYSVCNTISSHTVGAVTCNLSYQPEVLNESGITVPGSISDQKFSHGCIGSLDDEIHTIVIQLRGTKNKEPVQKPITVQTRLKCQTCGRTHKSSFTFCPNCGTSLQVI